MIRRCFQYSLCTLVTTQLIACQGEFSAMDSSNPTEAFSARTPATSTEAGFTTTESVPEKAINLLEDIEVQLSQDLDIFKSLEKQEDKLKTLDILTLILGLVFKPSSLTEKAGVQEKTSNPIKQLRNSVLKAVNKAYTLDDQILVKMAEIEPLLDPQNPLHLDTLERFEDLRQKLESFEMRIDTLVNRLNDKVGDIIKKIDLKMASYSFLDPRVYLLKKAKEYFGDLQKGLTESLE